MSLSLGEKIAPIDSKKESFPLRSVFLAALTPALLGVFCAVFIAPPILSHDTANGIRAWFNFIEGGAWNTVQMISPNSIAESIEYPVSWWAPGQYVPLGLLHSAGISLGTGMIVLSALSTLIFGLGLAVLAWAMKAPRKTLPWITFAACASPYMLAPFGAFVGGEVAQITVWPWAIFVAWTLRKRPLPLIIVLPTIFLIGAFGKHSFTIYALSILAFLWFEAFRDSAKQGIFSTRYSRFWSTTLTLCAVGALFVLGRHFLIDTSHTPGAQGMVTRSFFQSWGYSFYGPSLSLLGINSIASHIAYHLFKADVEGMWRDLGPALSLLSPLVLALYFWLLSRKSPMDRLAGNAALVVCSIFFFLLWKGGAISSESRHYQPISMLFLIAIGARILSPKRAISISSRILIAWVILLGCTSLTQRHLRSRSNEKGFFYSKYENVTLPDMPQSVQDSLTEIIRNEHTILTLGEVSQSCIINKGLHPTSRFLIINTESEYTSNNKRYGRVPRLVIALQNRDIDKPRAKHLRESFKDYREDEWTSYELDGWVIWQAGDAVAADASANQSE